MSMMASSTDRWAVSCRTRGEVSTAEAHVPGLAIHLLGLPDGFTRDEVEGWIGSLAAASREGAVAASPDDPIPPVLRHVLGGLLFSHAELWGRRAGGPVSVVLVSEHGRIAFGWVGEAAARVFEDGHELMPEWVSVRDHQGRESRAWCGDARRDLRIELACAPDSGSGPGHVEFEAHWTSADAETSLAALPGAAAGGAAGAVLDSIPVPEDPASIAAEPSAAGGFAAPPSAAEAAPEAPAPGQVSSPDETPAGPSDQEIAHGERPSSGVARWLSRALGWEKRPRQRVSEPTPEPTAERPEQPAEAEPAAIGDEAAFAPETPAPPVGVEVSPAPGTPGGLAGSSAPVEAEELEVPAALEIAGEDTTYSPSDVERQVGVDIPLPPGVPDEIPPTPEPPSLTERAVRAGLPLEDPRAISLPDRAERGHSGPGPASAAPPAAPPTWAPPAPEREIRPVDLSATAAHGGEPDLSAEAPVEPTAPAGGRARAQTPRRPEWPEPSVSEARSGPDLRRWAVGGVAVLLLFGAGWLVGSFQGGKGEQKPSPLVGLLRRIGIAGARFETLVTSRPAGAAIVVDGKDTGLHAPATVEMSPGEHRVDLSFADLGSVSFMVKGAKGDKVPLDAALWGAVDVTVSDPSTPISVAVDGEARGFAPMTLDSLAPGPHELRFTGPGMASWGTTIEVRVAETREVLAYPLQSPATGLLQVRAVINQEGESQPLSGARVFVDGQPRGQTPLTLELPRGPHSVRVAHQQETGPVQVIDLPGGNQRFATFEFGLNLEYPTLTLRAPATIPPDEPVLISATLGQVAAADVTEMWLHVCTPDGRWRRYPMTLIDAQGSAVGAAPFPAVLLGPDGKTEYYVSALTSQGDEHFTEMQRVSAVRSKPAR